MTGNWAKAEHELVYYKELEQRNKEVLLDV